jgi:hypothetical protein
MAVPVGTQRVYTTHWRRVLEVWADRKLDEPTPLRAVVASDVSVA